jgi:hypothetical protein
MHGKIGARRRGVQLIVFFAAIREILKKEIYAADKQLFCVMKTKGELVRSGSRAAGLPIQRIRFMNRGPRKKLRFLRLRRSGFEIGADGCDGALSGELGGCAIAAIPLKSSTQKAIGGLAVEFERG